ncbi:hypothetical protein QYE76_003539 [Lolium multiflorum]|uniref:Uncharacterized protein n=1 Tax=Lolium multiflorum TaxID=4521 RepID=A0AAD8W0J9_LOLMU|nr:hypothetical protein QYE76_003539 [Lolium multiflorum]
MHRARAYAADVLGEGVRQPPDAARVALEDVDELEQDIMVDSDDEYYFKNFIDTSSEEESDDEFFMEAALLIHEHIVSQIPVYRGSLPGYYLADGIYPPWATLVKTIRNPNSEQEARFAKEQEAARKMSSGRLASSKLVGLSSDTLPEPGMCKLCGR